MSSYLSRIEALQRILLAAPAFVMGFQEAGIDEPEVDEDPAIVIDLVALLRRHDEDNCDKRANEESGARNGRIVTVEAAQKEPGWATGKRAHGAS